MQPLISVIIPVYKVEAYLAACVESVLAQTYQNFEIVLVDDGSPDNCPQMCDDYASRDSRVRVIHKENGGVSAARNTGIDAALGEYLAFLDSDDLWSPLFLERLYSAILETDADFALCMFQRFYGEQPEMHSEFGITKVLNQREALRCLVDQRNEKMVMIWNKLYHRSMFNEVRYPVGRIHEDEAVIHEIIGGAKIVAWVDEPHYFYRQTPNSITTAKFNLKRLDETYAKEQRIAWFEAHGMHDLADHTRVIYLSNLMRLYRTVQQELEDKTAAQNACRKLYQTFRSVYSAELVRNDSLKFRLRCALFMFCPKLYSAFEYTRLMRKESL